jgi:cytochrome b561
MSDPTVYSTPHRIIHWVMALLIIAMVPVGIYMTNIPYPPNPAANPALKDSLYEWHKSFGIIIFLLAALRVVVRLIKGVPAPVPTLTTIERIASSSVHHLLYILIFAVPFAGWLATSMCYGPVNLFWTVPVTLPFSGSEATCGAIYKVHFGLAGLMTLLVFAHIGGAMMHLVIKRDGVFRRMWLS